jgi:hypothetical protein
VGGAVDLIGRSATALAGRTEGDDQEEWKIDAAVANTASPQLVRERLNEPGAAAEAFKTLTDAADDQYDTAKDADGEYELLRFHELTEGAATLFDAKTSDIVEAATNNRDGLSPDTLQSFAENVAFSPFTKPEVKQQVKETLQAWSKDHLGDGSEADSYQRALEVGQVLGTFQNGADAAVDRVGDDAEAKAKAENDAKNFFVDVTAGLLGGGATVLVNPVAGGAATQVSKHLLGRIFPDQDLQQARADAESGLRERLEQDGTSANLGQEITQLRNEQIGRALGRINHILQTDSNLSDKDREDLQNLSLALQNNRNGLEDGYHRARPE